MYRLMLIRLHTGELSARGPTLNAVLPDRVIAALGKRVTAKDAAEREE
jgi:hypothetical protein